jgi:hypothetical protein
VKALDDSFFDSLPLPEKNQDRPVRQLRIARQTGGSPADQDILDAIGRAKNADAFAALHSHGDLSVYDGDHSRADMALVRMLAFYTDDAEQIYRLVSRSALYRPEKEAKSKDYWSDTITKVIDRQTERYDWSRRVGGPARKPRTTPEAPDAPEEPPAATNADLVPEIRRQVEKVLDTKDKKARAEEVQKLLHKDLIDRIARAPITDQAQIKVMLGAIDKFPMREYTRALKAAKPPKSPLVNSQSDRLQICLPEWTMSQAIDIVEEALKHDPTIYKRGNRIVRVLRNDDGSPCICHVHPATVAERIDSQINIYKFDKDGYPDYIHPPDWLVDGLMNRGEYSSLRQLAGIVEIPTPRPDGTLIQTPGYDEATGLLFEPEAEIEFLPVAERPTREEAEAAWREIRKTVETIQFASDNDRSAWLAALLTVGGRRYVPGPVPGYAFIANRSMTGKTYSAALIHRILTGREPELNAYTADEEEVRKTLLSLAISPPPLFLVDNVPNGCEFGGAAWDAVLTSRTVSGRLLGTNEVGSFPWTSVLFVTGNNLGFKGDTYSRMCLVNIKDDSLNPEERNHEVDGKTLDEYALGNRAKLIHAALTILRAYSIAGDEVDLPPSRYRAWDRTIRAAVSWATGHDPMPPRSPADNADREAIEAEELVSAWAGLLKEMSIARRETVVAVTVSDALGWVESSTTDPLHRIFKTWSVNGKLPSTKTIGRKLAGFKDRMTEQGCLYQNSRSNGVTTWGVRVPPERPTVQAS